jgi:prepilin peptidase CpaA
MEWGTLELGLSAVLALLLCTTVVTDWRWRDIPNWLTGAIALGAPVFWWASGVELWPGAAIQIAVALVTLAVCAALFHFGAMGGGDVKLLAALALWLPGLTFTRMILIMAIAGGALTLFMLIRHKRAKLLGRPEIPYGIAIAFGGLWVLYERYLNHFA